MQFVSDCKRSSRAGPQVSVYWKVPDEWLKTPLVQGHFKRKRVNGGCCFSGKRASYKAVPSSAPEGVNYMNWGTEDNV